jgi:DNA-binding transcriptional LysR family regulator
MAIAPSLWVYLHRALRYLGIAAMMGWDDIRVFLELGRQASLSAAARRLKVDHSTVARRIAALEQRLGLKLFDRLPRGYALTPEGEELMATAARMEAEALALQRQASGAVTLHGQVRISAPPLLASHFLAPHFIDLRRSHPDIQIDLSGDVHNVDLARREADIALRMIKPGGDGLVARRIGAIGFGLYGARAYLRKTKPKDWSYIGYNDRFAHLDLHGFLRAQAKGQPLAFVSNDMGSLYQAARVGMGIAVLPHYIGSRDPLLRRVPSETSATDREMWLVVHPDLRRAPRIRTVMDFLVGLFERERRLLQGEVAAPPRPALAKVRA